MGDRETSTFFGGQAVLLAAGMGSRLGDLTKEQPKCMTRIKGMTILERAMQTLLTVGVRQFVIVTGHKNEVLGNYLRGLHPDLDITFVHNPDYATTNNIYSLWLAANAIRSNFLLIESDIIFTPKMLADLLPPCAASVSPLRDWMNGTVVTIDERRDVDAMYLKNDSRPDREAFKTVNMYSFDLKSWQNVVWPELDRAVRAGDRSSYYEKIFANAVRVGRLSLRAALCSEAEWFEVDTPEDILQAESGLAKFGVL